MFLVSKPHFDFFKNRVLKHIADDPTRILLHTNYVSWNYNFRRKMPVWLVLSGYDATNNLGFSLLYEGIKFVLTPITCNKSLCMSIHHVTVNPCCLCQRINDAVLDVELIKPGVNTLSSDNKTECEVERKTGRSKFLNC